MHSVLRARPDGRSRRGRSLALLAGPLLVVPFLASASGSAGADPLASVESPVVGGSVPSGDSTASSGSRGVEVTLITGDTVTWRKGTDGKPIVDVDPAPREDGHAVQFFSQGTSKEFYVFPSDVASYLASGVVDRELFNIPGLIRAGLSDRSSDTFPVITTFNERAIRSRTIRGEYAELADDADSLPATTHPVAIRTLRGAGVRVDRDNAEKFWDAIEGDGTAPARLDEGVNRVMLDRPVHASLDESVPQIGAPEVWDAGYTGAGVTVAVLDTGIDTSHPDLAGKVIDEENFTEADSVTDHFGHGTHVASTIAGSGAASDGRYKGVAPDADLMNGKVLDDNGFGSDSWVIAGMEWAAQNGADVANLSLSACCGYDGTDPVAQALNQLTAQYDTLFVVAAGNFGEIGIGTPGVADAALTVGAVDKSDQLADFSSRGPRLNDFAVKPNIMAPGVDITAARAAGTSLGSPVDDYYTSLSGTSMATPHVAGAAALLAQARPDLDASALKNALASTAVDVGYSWREQGTGRVDVARAVQQGVYAPAALDLGNLDEATGPVQRALTYTNHTDSPVTLSLDSELENPRRDPVADLTLSTDTVTVPANGESTVTVAVDPANYEPGMVGGAITATGTDVQLRTAVGFGQLDAQDVTIKVRDSAGNPNDPVLGVWLSHDDYDPNNPVGQDFYRLSTEDGEVTAQVPAGDYTLMTLVLETDPVTGDVTRSTIIMNPDVHIEADATFTLDARETVPVGQPTVPRKVAVRAHQVVLTHQSPNALPFDLGSGGVAASGDTVPIFVSPSRPARMGTDSLSLSDYWMLAQPQPLKALPDGGGSYSDAPAYSYHLAYGYPNGVPDHIQHTVKRRDLVAVPTRYHAENPDAVIAVTDLEVASHVHQGSYFTAGMVIRPGDVTEYYLADSRWFWLRDATMWTPEQPIWQQGMPMDSGDRFMDSEGGSSRAEENWFEAPLHVGSIEVDENFSDYYQGNVFATGRSATYARGGPDGNEFAPAPELMDNTVGHSTNDRLGGVWIDGWRWPSGGWASWQMWNADTGAELAPDGKYASSQPVFHLSAEPATYRLRQVETYPDFAKGLFETRPSATTEWTFRSRPSDARVPNGYDCSRLGGSNPLYDPNASLICQFQPLIQLRYELGLDIHNRAPAGRPHHFTIEAGSHSGAIDRAPVTDLGVAYSTDGGSTWRSAQVLGKPKNRDGYQRYSVVIEHPRLSRSDGSVWLRVNAEDANGGTVSQTIQRAYLLK
jgi:subtilisin family serine protease